MNNELQKEIENQTKCGLVVDTLPRPPIVSLPQYFIISLLFTSLEQKVLRAYTPCTPLGTWLREYIRNSKAGSRCWSNSWSNSIQRTMVQMFLRFVRSVFKQWNIK